MIIIWLPSLNFFPDQVICSNVVHTTWQTRDNCWKINFKREIYMVKRFKKWQEMSPKTAHFKKTWFIKIWTSEDWSIKGPM